MQRFFRKIPMVLVAVLVAVSVTGGGATAARSAEERDQQLIYPALDPVPFRDNNAPRNSGKRRTAETVAPAHAVSGRGAQEAERLARHRKDSPWRIRILDTAVVDSPVVTLGQVAEPVGTVPPGVWERLSAIELWPAPSEPGRPMTLLRAKIQQFVRSALGEYEELCLYPGSMALQFGGAVLREDALRLLVVKTLTGTAAKFQGEP